jgi:hypothetical protein
MKTSTRNKFLAYTVGSTAIALLLAVSSAQAVLIDTFTLGSNTTGSTASFSSSGLTVNAQAYARQGGHGGTISSANVFDVGLAASPNNNGLGVDHTGTSPTDSNPGQVDNLLGFDEWITFSSNGSITGISLALFNTDEQVRILGHNSANLFGSPLVDLVSDSFGGSKGVNGLVGNPDLFSFSDLGYNYVSVFAGVGGQFGDGGINDLFRVRGVEVVPEPSIIALFGLGIVGLGFSARRRRDI